MTQRDVIAERRRTRRGPVHVQDSLGATSGGSQDFSRHVLVAKRTDGQDLPPFTPPSYAGDCGLDLALSQDVEVAPGGTANVPCGVAVALPHGTFGWITGRSSTWSKHGLIVMAGIIDEGWRGELRVMLYRPLTADPLGQCSILHLPRGTRVAQLIVLPNLLEGLQVHFVEPYVALPDSERGTNGFGSSGS
jgi:dUTP pyrophosphatase